MTDLRLFTLVHEAISVIGVVAGFVVMYGFVRGDVSHFWNRLFLVLTLLTVSPASSSRLGMSREALC
jgi:hypothetical protein